MSYYIFLWNFTEQGIKSLKRAQTRSSSFVRTASGTSTESSLSSTLPYAPSKYSLSRARFFIAIRAASTPRRSVANRLPNEGARRYVPFACLKQTPSAQELPRKGILSLVASLSDKEQAPTFDEALRSEEAESFEQKKSLIHQGKSRADGEIAHPDARDGEVGFRLRTQLLEPSGTW